MMNAKNLTAVLFALTFVSQAVADESLPVKRLCYQEICLMDPVSKLSYPVIKVKPTGSIGRLDKETFAEAERLFVGKKSDVEALARAGFVWGRPAGTNQTTLNSIKAITTICGSSAPNFNLVVKAKNGKEVGLIYTPMTQDDGNSVYSVAAVLVDFPEVQSGSEQIELLALAGKSMQHEFQCNELGQGRRCRIVTDQSRQTIEVNPGKMTLMTDDSLFQMNRARQHPACRKEIKF